LFSFIILATRKCLPDWDCIKNLPLCSLWKLLQIVGIISHYRSVRAQTIATGTSLQFSGAHLRIQHELLFSTQWKNHARINVAHPLSSCRWSIKCTESDSSSRHL